MVEGAYFIPYSEKVELWGLVGLGQSEITTANSSATVTEVRHRDFFYSHV